MAGSWQALATPPAFIASTMLLLTDGTVMCQESGGVNWWRLSPDAHGDYLNGTWSALAPMHHTRLYYASAVLKDGRVVVLGGEYSNAGSETNTAEIYDPVLDQWSEISAPPGWARIGDAACAVLPDGRLLLGNLDDTRTALYDATSNTWTAGPAKNDASSEETWTLLPDGTVLVPECSHHPQAEKYVAAANQWVSAGSVPVDLVEAASIEIGPATLLPDGRVFCVGATNATALYTRPPIANQPGTWTVGPTFPNDAAGRALGAKDAPACLLPNGHVLCSVGPVDGQRDSYLGPTCFFEFDGAGLVRVADPPNSGGVPYQGRMLLLPTGQVLYAAETKAIYAYSPDGYPEWSWRPQITAFPAVLRPLHSYSLHGRQFNGLSQAVAYGDDAAAATNYPLIRLRHLPSGRVRYLRSFDHSSMGVATGSTAQATNFAVPFDVDLGWSELCVVANGIASAGMPVFVAAWKFPFPLDEAVVQKLIGSLADGPLWVLGPNGPVPVDPWGPKQAAAAARAWKQVLGGLAALRKLGKLVQANRGRVSGAVPPAVDEDAAQAQRTAARRGAKKASTAKRRGARKARA
ncbi:MAG: hypothetical protein JSS42_08615 [Proteobacteria bacterium]|uniref:Kelch repeat-containing protein n=1 Tax=Rudaea sp. TaxID=2136325 RepID=UPI0032204A17|nr:hypothetical protein [Pseudomonadota bacterium]